MRSIMLAEDISRKAPLPEWLRPAVAGLLLGIIAVGFPEVLGVGYETTSAALSELYPLWLLIALIVLKTAATAICLGGGFAGGVFSPSLFIGAMVGGRFWHSCHRRFPATSPRAMVPIP